MKFNLIIFEDFLHNFINFGFLKLKILQNNNMSVSDVNLYTFLTF